MNSMCAPELLFLYMGMAIYDKWSNQCRLFRMQYVVQLIALGIIVICVFVLLFGVPLRVHSANRKEISQALKQMSHFRTWQEKEKTKVKKKDGKSFDLMIIQLVLTIEFLLSTILHVASYLRIWALSVGHSLLSEMCWALVFGKLGLRDFTNTKTTVFKICLAFALWAFLTVAVLVLMEGLCAFMHTLRLHWIEFMSKFFIGGGAKFRPFCFKEILAKKPEREDICLISKLKKKQREEIKMETGKSHIQDKADKKDFA